MKLRFRKAETLPAKVGRNKKMINNTVLIAGITTLVTSCGPQLLPASSDINVDHSPQHCSRSITRSSAAKEISYELTEVLSNRVKLDGKTRARVRLWIDDTGQARPKRPPTWRCKMSNSRWKRCKRGEKVPLMREEISDVIRQVTFPTPRNGSCFANISTRPHTHSQEQNSQAKAMPSSKSLDPQEKINTRAEETPPIKQAERPSKTKKRKVFIRNCPRTKAFELAVREISERVQGDSDVARVQRAYLRAIMAIPEQIEARIKVQIHSGSKGRLNVAKNGEGFALEMECFGWQQCPEKADRIARAIEDAFNLDREKFGNPLRNCLFELRAHLPPQE